MNFDSLQPLDAPEEAKLRRSPAEHRAFLVIFCIQYLLLITGFLNDNMGGIVWLVISLFLVGILHIFIGIWQVLSAVISLNKRSDERRRLYLILVGINLGLIVFFIFSHGFLGGVAASIGQFLALTLLPHALAWFYWYICYSESK